MEPLAVEWGIPSDKYWQMTYDEIITQVEANKNRYELEMKNKAMFDYNAAQLNAYAFNQPEKMPKPEKMYPFLQKENGDEVLNPQTEEKPISQQEYNMDEDKTNLMQAIAGVNRTLKQKGSEQEDGN